MVLILILSIASLLILLAKNFLVRLLGRSSSGSRFHVFILVVRLGFLSLGSCLALGAGRSTRLGDASLERGLGDRGVLRTSGIASLARGWGFRLVRGGAPFARSSDWKVELLLHDGDLVGDGFGVLEAKSIGDLVVVNLNTSVSHQLMPNESKVVGSSTL